MDLIFQSFGRKKPRHQYPKIRFGEKNLCKTNNFGLKTRKSGFQKHEVSGRNFEVSVEPKVSVQNPEVSGKIFELETSVKVVFRNASLAETRNFE
jgi:hypothetical protein